MSIKEITIVITSFNSDEKINSCLHSIDSDCKVVLVENSNNTEFKKKIEKDFPNVECTLTGENLGYGKANNIGLKKVETKFALILNPDTKLHKSTLKNLINCTNKISDFAIIGPSIQEEENEKEIEKTRDATLISVENIKGYAMFLNLSEFKEVGFFDERFFIYFEEIDLCLRLKNNGKKIYLAPDVKIYHLGGQSHNRSINKEMELSRNWHWMWSTFNYHKKHKGFFISLIIIMPKLISALFKVLIYSLFFQKEKKDIYYQRLSGLINAIIGKNSWYRPKIKN